LVAIIYLVFCIVVKFQEINLKFGKVQAIIKFEKNYGKLTVMCLRISIQKHNLLQK